MWWWLSCIDFFDIRISSYKYGIAHHWEHVRYGYSYMGHDWWFNVPVRKFWKRLSCVHGNLEASSWRVFEMQERINQRNGQDCSCCYSYQFQWWRSDDWTCAKECLKICFHVFIPAQLCFGHLCNWETHQPWRWIRTGNSCLGFIFMALKRPYLGLEIK